MPRVRRGPEGPGSSAGGVQGTNRDTPHKGAGTSGQAHEADMVNKGADEFYGGSPKRAGKGYS
jgi:hypothetical protein